MKISRRDLIKIIHEELDSQSLLEIDTDGSGDLSPDELRDIADDLEGESEFAATAAEEAERINQQVQGAAYPTDQEYWEKSGISTGEDLAKSVLAQTYSDAYKSMYGTRPRLPFSEMSVEKIQSMISSLDDDWYEMRHYEDQAWKDDDPEYIARGKAIEAEYEADKAQRAEEEEFERMRTPEEGEDEPKRMGMGRRPLVGPARDVRRGRKISEETMKITRRQLRHIINEELSSIIETVDEKSVGNYCIRKGDSIASVTDRHSPKGVTWQMNAKLNDLKAPYTIHPKDNLKIWVTPDYEGEANCPQVKPPPVNEAIMVSLKPITSHPDTGKAATDESRWAKLSGIPEEHINLNETIMDTTPMMDLMGDMAGEIADRFGNEMERLWDEDPAMMREQGYTDRSQWSRQVGSAEIQLEETIKNMVTQAVQDIETRLHDGGYYDRRDDVSSMGGRDSDATHYTGGKGDEYPKHLGYKHPETGEDVMIMVQTRDDMDDILDPLLRQYPDLPYSVD